MKLKIVCGIILALGSMSAAAQSFNVPAELGPAPGSGQAVRDNAQLSKAFAAYFQLAQPRVRLHHHKRDESSAQAEELRGWLIALGIEAGRIELMEDSPTDQLTLDITDSR